MAYKDRMVWGKLVCKASADILVYKVLAHTLAHRALEDKVLDSSRLLAAGKKKEAPDARAHQRHK